MAKQHPGGPVITECSLRQCPDCVECGCGYKCTATKPAVKLATETLDIPVECPLPDYDGVELYAR